MVGWILLVFWMFYVIFGVPVIICAALLEANWPWKTIFWVTIIIVFVIGPLGAFLTGDSNWPDSPGSDLEGGIGSFE